MRKPKINFKNILYWLAFFVCFLITVFFMGVLAVTLTPIPFLGIMGIYTLCYLYLKSYNANKQKNLRESFQELDQRTKELQEKFHQQTFEIERLNV